MPLKNKKSKKPVKTVKKITELDLFEVPKKKADKMKEYNESLQSAKYGDLDQSALRSAAKEYLSSGKMPAMGRGAAVRQKIVSEADKMRKPKSQKGKETMDQYMKRRNKGLKASTLI